MNPINVFISVGTTCSDAQEAFVTAIETRLRAEGLSPNTVGRNTFSADAPLKSVTTLMNTCSGAIIVALERVYYPNGIERRNGPRQKELGEVQYTTVWNHIEAALAYAKGQPIMVIVEEGLKSEGLLEKGYDWYVMSVKPDASSLNTAEFSGVLASWSKKVSEFDAAKGQKVAEKQVDTASLSIGDLIRGLRPASLWALIGALLVLIAGSFALGQRWAAMPASNDLKADPRSERSK